MELSHRFTVPVGVDDAWATFNDLERIAPCFPGATLASVDGDDFTGSVKVKLGPISLQYNGTGHFVERDDAAHRAVVEARGKDRRGNGTAAATVTAQLSAGEGKSTDVEVATELNITGKPAQFGRGVMQDVSDKLLAQFAACLETKLSAAAEPEGEAEVAMSTDAAAAAAAAVEPIVEPDAVAAGGATAEAVEEAAAVEEPATEPEPAGEAEEHDTPAGAEPGPPAKPAEAEPADEAAAELDLGATLVPILLKRYAPYLVAALVGAVLLWKLTRRRRH